VKLHQIEFRAELRLDLCVQDGARSLNVNVAFARQRARMPPSHDNLFHWVLGLLAVSTPRYRAGRDLLADCRAPQRARAH
jgi:glucan phosphoethanolaminetransferase (alkaline phosphatase superfamily)